MKHQKIMNDFRIYMGKRNRSVYGWIVIWLTAVALFLTTAEKADVTAGGRVWQIYLLGAGLLILMAVGEYVRKYTHFYGMEPASNETSVVGVPAKEELADIVKCISFDAGTYCFLLGKRLLPTQMISVAAVIAIGMLLRVQILQIGLFAGMIMVLPWMWLWLKKTQLQFAMTCGGFAGSKFLIGFLRSIWGLARILLVGLSFVHFATFVIEICGTSKLLAGISDQEVVRFSMGGNLWLIATIVSSIGISLFFTDTDKELVITLWGKVRTGIIAVLAVILVLSIGMYCRNVTNGELVKLTENSITVRQNGRETRYGLEDITDYRIYCQNSAIQMELSFMDGSKETIFKGAAEDTEGWQEAYYSDYNYVAHLVESLAKLGVTGTLEDSERLEQIVNTYDPQCIEGFRYFSGLLAER